MVMSSSVSARCSGSFFSSLLFELMKNSKSQEGFLLGDVQTVTSHSISDSQIRNENTNIVINVTTFIPCSCLGNFYSGCGSVKLKYLETSIGKDWEKVVGWYRYRGSCDEVYLREMKVHQQLRNAMKHTDGYFLLASLSAIQPAHSGTLDVNYKFQIMHDNNEFEGVSLEIVNMSDTSASQFIKTPTSAELYSSSALKKIVESITNIEPGVAEAEQLHKGLVNQLQGLLPKYGTIQERHHKLMQEVMTLQTVCQNSGIISDFQSNETSKNCGILEIESTSPVLTRLRKNLANDDSKQVSEKTVKPAIKKKKNKVVDTVTNEDGIEEFSKGPVEEICTGEKNESSQNAVNCTTTVKGKAVQKEIKAQNRTQKSASPKVKTPQGRRRQSSSSSCSPAKGDSSDSDFKEKTVVQSPSRTRSPRDVKAVADENMTPRTGRQRSPSINNQKLLKSKTKETCGDSPEF